MNSSYPHLGATPDRIINCDCCGDGVIEIKCPYKHRDKHLHHVADPQFYLKRNNNGELHLCRNHEYYSQIQGQLAVCEKEYCVTLCAGSHMACMWNAFSMNQHTLVTLSQPLIHSFLQYCSLCYSLADVNFQREVPTVCHNPITTPTTRHTKVTPLTVGVMEETIRDMGRMVACDNPNCPREWFHFECVGLTRKPRGKWYCSDSCRGQASISM